MGKTAGIKAEITNLKNMYLWNRVNELYLDQKSQGEIGQISNYVLILETLESIYCNLLFRQGN